MSPTPGRTDTASLLIAAPPDALYRAFADATALMAWLPPAGMTGRALQYDFREGGRYRIELTYGADSGPDVGKTSSHTDVTSGSFRALEVNRRIVQSVEFDSADESFAGEMVMTWSFAPAASGTLVTVTAEGVPPGIRPEDHDEGLRSSLANLARFAAGAAGGGGPAPA